jgi:hypothetical protein
MPKPDGATTVENGTDAYGFKDLSHLLPGRGSASDGRRP